MIEQLVSTLTELAAQHSVLVYTVVFWLAAAEALPVVGTPIPGTAVIVGISALVPSEALEIWPLIVAAVIGAVGARAFSSRASCRGSEGPFRRLRASSACSVGDSTSLTSAQH